jgi:hypothetical protein
MSISSTPPAGNDSRVSSLFNRELQRLAEKFADADAQLWRARVRGDKGELEAAEDERQKANGDFFAATQEMADLFLLLLRQCLALRKDALRLYLADALSDDFAELADAIVAIKRGVS